jgi:hypothetical protein
MKNQSKIERMGNQLKRQSKSWKGFILLLIWFLTMAVSAESQPVIKVRLSNPVYNCSTQSYCLDVEFQSNTQNQQLFAMNVRFYYDDNILEFQSFGGFQGGYGPVSPNPPLITTGIPTSGPVLFTFAGPAEFVNGAIQLVNTQAAPIPISTTGWTKLFSMFLSQHSLGSAGRSQSWWFCKW